MQSSQQEPTAASPAEYIKLIDSELTAKQALDIVSQSFKKSRGSNMNTAIQTAPSGSFSNT